MRVHDPEQEEDSADRRSDAPYPSAHPAPYWSLAATVWRGLTLVHRGSDIGVITHVTWNGDSSVPTLHAIGGISRSLEYTLPETAIVGVFAVSCRAAIADEVEFEPQHLRADGRVILAPRVVHETDHLCKARWLELPPSAWVGVRVYADDGYLGIIEAALSRTEAEMADLLVVRVRMPFWKLRFPVVPVTRVVVCASAEKVARMTGTRSELASMSERRPLAG